MTGTGLSAPSAHATALDTSSGGGSAPQRGPRAGRHERGSRTNGGTPKAAGRKLANGTAGNSAAGGEERGAKNTPATAQPTQAPAPLENGISPADKVITEPVKRAPSGGAPGTAPAAEAAARSALSGLGAWGRPLGS